VDRRVGRRAQRVVGAQHLVLLDQLADHFDGLGRAVAVVERDELDHAAVDAAPVIDALPVGLFALADHTVGRRRPAVGIGVTDLDLLVGRAVVVLLLSERYSGTRKHRGGA
jgi:hypothetical protein